MRGLGAALGIAAVLLAGEPGVALTIDAALGSVDGRLIALSDVALARALGLFGLEPSNSPIGRSDLDRYIDAQLAVAEATRLAIEVSADEIARAWDAAGGDVLGTRLEQAGLDRAWARRLIEADLRVQRFVDLRFRAFTFVTDGDIEAALGSVPSDEATREQTRERLSAGMVAQALATWQRSARERAVIRLAPDADGPWPEPFALPAAAGR